MSKEAIQAVVNELESLPETDQSLVLEFLAGLKEQRRAGNSGSGATERGPALAIKDGLLLFTGQLDVPDADWVRLVREERDMERMRSSVGRSKGLAPDLAPLIAAPTAAAAF